MHSCSRSGQGFAEVPESGYERRSALAATPASLTPTLICFERSPAPIHSSSTMFGSIPNYFYERRNGLLRATSYAGAAYLATSYVKEQLQDVKDEVLLKRKAREK